VSKPLPKQDLAQVEAIQRVAIGLYETGFVFARKEAYQPRKGTLVFQLWQGKKLSLRHQRGWWHFTTDLYEACGKSGPVVSGYGDVRSTNPQDFKVPKAYVNAQYRRLERLMASLDDNEKILLRDLIYDELQQQKVLTVELIGFHLNGYKNCDQARAAGIATITYLLSRIAGFYSVA